MKKLQYFLITAVILSACQSPSLRPLADQLAQAERISGRNEYLSSPYLTPGDRTYMVGHQNGSFPDLGWHVTGEMGGIWNHPIKLMDGFGASVNIEGETFCLDKADAFINYPYANQHHFNFDEIEITRSQIVPDGHESVYVEFEITNKSDEEIWIDFTFNGFVDLMPVWLGERTNMINADDEAVFNEELGIIEAKDTNNDWHVVYGSSIPPKAHHLNAEVCDFERRGEGTRASLTYALKIPASNSQVMPIFIAGSSKSKEDALHEFSKSKSNIKNLIYEKAQRYYKVSQNASLKTPNDQLNQAFLWTKYNTDWLINDVEGLGRAITAGNADYPWFFGADSEYALQGAIAIGMKELVYSTIHLIDSVSNVVNHGSGRILHEISTNGAVFNRGNLNETPQYAILIWDIFKWTGDMEFLEKYYPTVEAGLDWLLEENDEDGNLIADGYGMMEIHGLASEMIDVASYTYKAFSDAAEMAEILGYQQKAKEYRANAVHLAEIINTEFWVEEFNSFADFMGTVIDADELIDGAIVRADTLNKPWAVEELKATRKQISTFESKEKRGFVLYHNWVVNTPMEVGVADYDKAIKALHTGSKYSNPFGMFVTGIDRDESACTDSSGFAEKMKVFSYTGAVMTLPTGVQAIAENNYGRPDQALKYLELMTNTFSYALPGSIYEVSPDFGMHTQAWTIYSYAVPIIKQFFGIQPMAHLNQIYIRPQMPTSWNEASIDQIQIANNVISMIYERTDEGEKVIIEQSDPTYNIMVEGSVEVVQAARAEDRQGCLALNGNRIEVLIR